MKTDEILSLLGIAAKAGKIASGGYQTERAIKSGKAHLVIVAGDASENTKKMFRNMCEFYHVELRCYEKKENLGYSIGRMFRSCLAVTDEGLAKAVLKKLL